MALRRKSTLSGECVKRSFWLPLVLAVPIAVLPATFAAGAAERATPADCSYEMKVWNVNEGKSTRTVVVNHAYADLSASERDAVTGCTVCSEDQETINIPPLQPFEVCYRVASHVRTAVSGLVQRGEAPHTVVGYHVIQSRGPVDGDGNRTGFSNHSFGTAVDIDPEQNGLYDNCVSFGPQCRLLRGGAWHPGQAGSLTKDSAIVRFFDTAGFKWGGEIAGKQKDFMHFSPTGY